MRQDQKILMNLTLFFLGFFLAFLFASNAKSAGSQWGGLLNLIQPLYEDIHNADNDLRISPDNGAMRWNTAEPKVHNFESDDAIKEHLQQYQDGAFILNFDTGQLSMHQWDGNSLRQKQFIAASEIAFASRAEMCIYVNYQEMLYFMEWIPDVL